MAVGVVGPGAMGLPMALNLLQAGFDVHFASRRREAAESLVDAGAVEHKSVESVTAASDFVLSCLPADHEIIEVFVVPGDGLAAMEANSVVIECSTALPTTVETLAAAAAARGIRVLDAPVSGGVYGAEQGTLTVMVGGDDATLERCRPVLDAIGSRIFHVGPAGMGKTFKIINNMLTGVQTALVGEALAVAAKAGADIEALFEVVGVSSGNSDAWRNTVLKMVDPPDAPGFRLELMRKDLGLAAALAQDHDVGIPIASTAAQFYAAAVANGLGSDGTHDVARFIAGISGVEFDRR